MHKQQFIGACTICILVTTITAVTIFVPRLFKDNDFTPADWEYCRSIADSIEQSVFLRKDSIYQQKKKQWEAEKEARRIAREIAYEAQKAEWEAEKATRRGDTITIRMQAFDPNTADSITLLRVGFKPWQAKGMLRYRAAGGRYKKADDLKKIYGMTDSIYATIAPWVTITAISTDTIARPLYAGHEKKDTIIDLNLADTSSLQFIRGIGPVMAKQIISYRNRLGGFVSINQLAEIKGLPALSDSTTTHLIIASPVFQQLKVSSLSASQLAKHPYINYQQATAIENLHRKRRITHLNQIQQLGCFTPEEWQKLLPYLTLE